MEEQIKMLEHCLTTKTLCAILCLLVHTTHSQTPDNTIRPITDDNPTCQFITTEICSSVDYHFAYFPNFRGHETEAQAVGELTDFLPVINSGCSNAILHFLCGYYLPFCFVNSLGNPIILHPCRSLCEYVRSTCEATLISSGFSWPSHLNCSLEKFHPSPQCFGPPNPSTVILQPISIVPTSVMQVSSLTSIPPVTSTPPLSLVPSTFPPQVTSTPLPTDPETNAPTNRATQAPGGGGGALFLQPSVMLVTMVAVIVMGMLRYMRS